MNEHKGGAEQCLSRRTLSADRQADSLVGCHVETPSALGFYECIATCETSTLISEFLYPSCILLPGILFF